MKSRTQPNIANLMLNYEPTNNNVSLNITEKDDSLFSDLQNDVYQKTPSDKSEAKLLRQQQKQIKEQEAQERREARALKKLQQNETAIEKQLKKQEAKQMKQLVLGKSNNVEADDDEEGTQILGREKLELYAKINQYKLLFPDNRQLQKLKIKKNASTEELVLYLNECDAYISTSSVDDFITQSILQSIKITEYVSSKTRYNLTGLSDMLKSNIQFNSLTKQLYLKYKVFSQVPPEQQLLLIVATSAWICLEKNKIKPTLEKQVNEKDFD